MSDPTLHHKITYIEFTTPNIEQTRRFYTEVFGWQFQNWGADYLGFDGRFCQGRSPANHLLARTGDCALLVQP